MADDNREFREALQRFLEPEFRIAASVADGQALLEAARAIACDVVIADISMPVLNGFQAVRQLRAARPDVRVIFLTIHEDNAYLTQARKTGALGYVLKRHAPDNLIPAIRAVLQGRSFYCPSTVEDTPNPAPTSPAPQASQ